jgi:integrase
MADANLTKRIAELEAEIERLKAEAATSRPLRRRLGGKLTDRKLKSFNQPGHVIGDGNNLLYKCSGLGLGCWIYRYKVHGKARDVGLGAYPSVSVAEARIARDEHNRLRNQGQDPRAERQRQKDTAKLARAKTVTFAQCAEGYFQGQEKGWRSPKHARQWTQILNDYIDPVIGALPVAAVDTGLVMQVIEPLWLTKTETASRTRQIIEAVLDWAKAREYRDGENPVRWRGHLQTMLPKKSTVHTVIHHPALPWQGLPEFMARMQKETSPAALALQVTALCGLRTNEIRLAQWSEFDFANRVWTIPASRMKGRKGHSREHRVPLTETVVEILERLRQTATGRFVFATPGADKPFGVNGMLQVLARLGVKVTTHGFRSCLADWSAEKTNFAHEVREMCLAHTIDSKVEKAYRRGDLFAKRKQLMEQWARFCTSPAPEGEVVVPFTAKRA